MNRQPLLNLICCRARRLADLPTPLLVCSPNSVTLLRTGVHALAINTRHPLGSVIFKPRKDARISHRFGCSWSWSDVDLHAQSCFAVSIRREFQATLNAMCVCFSIVQSRLQQYATWALFFVELIKEMFFLLHRLTNHISTAQGIDNDFSRSIFPRFWPRTL